eukprot:PITA_22724
MDVKLAFLNGELEEEVCIEQPKGFLLSNKEDYFYRLKKALYGFKQAPWASYAHLDRYLHQQGFKKGIPDNNLYVKVDRDNLKIIKVYVDDIIFGSTDDRLSKYFATKMQKAEYVAETACCTQVLWMKKTSQDLQVKFDEPIPIFFDNTNAINISKNPMMHSKTKHIPIKYHFIREIVVENNIKLEYVGTKEQIADIFTKQLPREGFDYLGQKLGILPSFH